MIRYDRGNRNVLEALVDAHEPDWRTDAAQRTAALVAAGAFNETTSVWSKIKVVFMELQHFKCIFCERPLARKLAGRVEQDVEHFRPKSSVKAWPGKQTRKQPLAYPFTTGPAGNGYYWLAYDLENYAASCKPCNSARKRNIFPIAGARGMPTTDVITLNAVEQPFLIYPLGGIDNDPEDLITFDGILAVPRYPNGPEHGRALVTIELLALNAREELWPERFRVIREVWNAFRTINTDPDPLQQAAAQRAMQAHLEDSAPHASCARSFERLTRRDPVHAWRIYCEAERLAHP